MYCKNVQQEESDPESSVKQRCVTLGFPIQPMDYKVRGTGAWPQGFISQDACRLNWIKAKDATHRQNGRYTFHYSPRYQIKKPSNARLLLTRTNVVEDKSLSLLFQHEHKNLLHGHVQCTEIFAHPALSNE